MPSCQTFPIRINQNNAFYAFHSYVEQVNEDFLTVSTALTR